MFTFGPKSCMYARRPKARHIIDWIHSSSFPQTLGFSQIKNIKIRYIDIIYACSYLLLAVIELEKVLDLTEFYCNLMPFQYAGKKTSKIWWYYWNNFVSRLSINIYIFRHVPISVFQKNNKNFTQRTFFYANVNWNCLHKIWQ